MKEIRVAVAGAGFWAGYQIAGWQELPGVRVVAVCDRNQAKAERLAAARGVPAVYTDAGDMLRRERPDLLDIITDVASHAPLVKLAAAEQIPVICQKPLAATLAECEELVQVCDVAGVWFAVHENWRWQAPLRRAKDILAAGAIGRPFRARIDMLSSFDVFANQPSLRADERFIIADLGGHLLDYARSCFGEVESIYCRTARVRPDIRGEDAATIVLTMQSSRTIVTINMAYAGTPLERECFPQTLMFVEGDSGSLDVTPSCILRVTTSEGTRVEHVPPPFYAWVDSAYAVAQASVVPCLDNLADSLRAGLPAETSATDNARTMRLVFAAYDSAESGAAVWP